MDRIGDIFDEMSVAETQTGVTGQTTEEVIPNSMDPTEHQVVTAETTPRESVISMALRISPDAMVLMNYPRRDEKFYERLNSFSNGFPQSCPSKSKELLNFRSLSSHLFFVQFPPINSPWLVSASTRPKSPATTKKSPTQSAATTAKADCSAGKRPTFPSTSITDTTRAAPFSFPCCKSRIIQIGTRTKPDSPVLKKRIGMKRIRRPLPKSLVSLLDRFFRKTRKAAGFELINKKKAAQGAATKLKPSAQAEQPV